VLLFYNSRVVQCFLCWGQLRNLYVHIPSQMQEKTPHRAPSLKNADLLKVKTNLEVQMTAFVVKVWRQACSIYRLQLDCSPDSCLLIATWESVSRTHCMLTGLA
jgi:hypothetical protein